MEYNAFAMSNHKFHKNVRIPGYDYTQPGAYFLTICSYQRKQIFSKIHDTIVHPSPLGNLLKENWTSIPARYPGCELGEYVLMPNHMHAIFVIIDPNWRKSLGQLVQTFKAAVTKQAAQKGLGQNIWQHNYFEHIIRSDLEMEKITEYILTNPLTWGDQETNPTEFPAELFN